MKYFESRHVSNALINLSFISLHHMGSFTIKIKENNLGYKVRLEFIEKVTEHTLIWLSNFCE